MDTFFVYVWRISIIGNAAVLKTAGLTPLGVRVPHPPHEHIFSGEVVRLSRVRTAAQAAMIDHQVNPNQSLSMKEKVNSAQAQCSLNSRDVSEREFEPSFLSISK